MLKKKETEKHALMEFNRNLSLELQQLIDWLSTVKLIAHYFDKRLAGLSEVGHFWLFSPL